MQRPTPSTTYQEITSICDCGFNIGSIQIECEKFIMEHEKKFPDATTRESLLLFMENKGITNMCCRCNIINPRNKMLKDITKNAFVSLITDAGGRGKESILHNNLDENTKFPYFFVTDEKGNFFTHKGSFEFDENEYSKELSNITGLKTEKQKFMKLTPTKTKNFPLNMRYLRPMSQY